MQDEKFTKEFIVDYQDIKEDGTAGLPRILHYFQEMSLLHSRHAGYDTKWFVENQRGFLLTGWQIQVTDYPKWGDKIRVMTWATQFKGIIAKRSFLMVSEGGETLAAANSNWVFTDIQRHMPVRISQEMMTAFGPVFPVAFPPDFELPELSAYDLVNKETFIVRRSDIDTNHHVNNVRYVQWAMDYIPDALYKNGTVRELKVAYKKECRLGDTVVLETYQSNMDSGRIMTLIKAADEIAVHGAIETVWQ